MIVSTLHIAIKLTSMAEAIRVVFFLGAILAIWAIDDSL